MDQQYNTGEKPTVIYCTLILIAMQGHQTNLTFKRALVANPKALLFITRW